MSTRLAIAVAGGLAWMVASAACAAVFSSGSFAFNTATTSRTDVTVATAFPLSSPVTPNAGTDDFSLIPLPQTLQLPAGAVNFTLVGCCNWTHPLLGTFVGTAPPVRTQTTPHPNGSATWEVVGQYTVSVGYDNAGEVLFARMTWVLSQTGGPTAATSIGGSFYSAKPPTQLLRGASRKLHGAAGTFDLPLSLTPTAPTTEPRSGGAGGNHTIVFVFEKRVIAGNASVTAGTGTAGTPTFGGNEMIVPLTGVTNQQYVTVGVSNVAGSDGSTGGSASVRIGFLLGDVSQTRVVTVSDLAQVNAQIAQVVAAANYLKDVNASGTLTVADKGIANTQITKALPAP